MTGHCDGGLMNGGRKSEAGCGLSEESRPQVKEVSLLKEARWVKAANILM